jgi:tripartite-type tricarboxylate transporter receptor subunit TctC
MRLLKRAALFALVSLILAPAGASAADYPTHPVRMIVGFGAGSSGDVAARILGQKLTSLLGESVVVENKPGASSILATEYVARAPKDGYTLFLATIAVAINSTMMPHKGINLEKDLAPVALVASMPEVLVVSPKLGAKNVQDLIALAQKKPGDLLYGASGAASGPRLATELFAKKANIKMTAVLYPSSAQTVTDLMSDRIQVMLSPASTVLGLLKDDRVKALAVTQAKRAKAAPDLPTLAESGVNGFNTGLWFGLFAPAGTPQPVIDKLNKAVNEALKDPNTLKQLHLQGLDELGGTPTEFAEYIKSETERWAEVIHALNLTPKKQ